MTLELNFGSLLTLAIAFIGALWALVKIIAAQHEKALEIRFKAFGEIATQQENALEKRFKALGDSLDGLKGGMQREQETTQRLERELLQFKAELPRDYVRREDFIRAVGTIETKIDNMALRMERAVLNSKNGSDI